MNERLCSGCAVVLTVENARTYQGRWVGKCRPCESAASRTRLSNPDRATVMLRLPADLHGALKAAAVERGVSMNWLVERGITEFLDRLIPVDELRLTRRDP